MFFFLLDVAEYARGVAKELIGMLKRCSDFYRFVGFWMRFAIKMIKFAMNLLETNARRQEIVILSIVAVRISFLRLTFYGVSSNLYINISLHI